MTKPEQKKQVPHDDLVEKDKEIREKMPEKKIDKMVEDSFPASDPPSTY